MIDGLKGFRLKVRNVGLRASDFRLWPFSLQPIDLQPELLRSPVFEPFSLVSPTLT